MHALAIPAVIPAWSNTSIIYLSFGHKGKNTGRLLTEGSIMDYNADNWHFLGRAHAGVLLNGEEKAVICTLTPGVITWTTTIGTSGSVATAGVVAVIALTVFLSIKELASASPSPSSQLVARFANVSIAPMTMVFAAIVAVKIAEILG